MGKPIYVIEHLEEGLGSWSLMEYRHISSRVGKERLWISRVQDEASRSTLAELADHVVPCTAEEHFRELGIDAGRVCVLTPYTDAVLSPADADLLDFAVVGGILGDFEFNGATHQIDEHLPGAVLRHLGDRQLTTDGAVLFTEEVLCHRVPLDKIPHVDDPDIVINAHETQSMPFRYLADATTGQPVFPPGFMEELKKC